MTTMNKYFIGALAFVLMAVGGWFFSATERTSPAFGAQSVQVTDGDCFIGPTGGHECNLQQAITATSSVICSFQMPNATSTVSRISFSVSSTTSNSMGAQVVYVSTSTTRVGSSTPTLSGLVSIPSDGDYYAWYPNMSTSTQTAPDALSMLRSGGTSNDIIKPNLFLNFRIATATPRTLPLGYWSGKCNATIEY